jgi:DNA polymerase
MSDEVRDERHQVMREVRQRLESLRRAGLERVPASELTFDFAASPDTEEPSPAPQPEAPRRAAAAPVTLPAASLFGESELSEVVVPESERAGLLAVLAAEVATCQKCPHLAATRTQTVFGTGSATARLMFVGEAPGAEEDRQGIPFVGRAGMLLTDMITKGMGLAREDVYIANILKSRPPENRDPEPQEVANCLPYLERQIEIIRPSFLCLLGRYAAQSLLNTALSLSRLRKRWHRYRGILTLVTFHPAYLLRNPDSKKDAWEDLKMLMDQMGLKPPERRRRT